MSRQTVKRLPFPIHGLIARYAIEDTNLAFTNLANNVWPSDWTEGRERGGTRPGLNSIGSGLSGTPRVAGEATWDISNTTSRGIYAVTSAGLYVTTNGTWTQLISASVNAFSGAALVFNKIYLANRGVSAVRVFDLGAVASGGNPADLTASAGAGVPAYCGVACAYQGRLFLASPRDEPNTYFASRIGDPTDWDYAPASPDGAMAFASNTGNGNGVGQPITALVQHTEDCLIIGMTDSTAVLLGNPTTSGAIKTVSPLVGPLEQSACCHGPNGVFYCMTRDGLYSMPYGCGGALSQESRNAMPDELRSIDPATEKTSIAYDLTWLGLHISVSGRNVHYFFDVQTGGWWPMSFDDGGTPYLSVAFPAIGGSNLSAMLSIDSSSNCYQFDRTNAESESVDSKLGIGPFRVGPEGMSGQLMEITGTLAPNSDPVQPELYFGDSAQECLAEMEAGTDPVWTGNQWATQGRNLTQKPRRNGVYAGLLLKDVNEGAWSMEKASVLTSPRSRERNLYG